MTKLERLTDEIAAAAAAMHSGPFPYEDCRKVLESTNVAYPALIPDLDMYFFEVASHASGVSKMLLWPHSRMEESALSLAKSFFERHPEYSRLRDLITDAAAPTLNRRLQAADHARALLLQLINELTSRGERGTPASVEE